jgi:hypothetical protein
MTLSRHHKWLGQGQDKFRTKLEKVRTKLEEAIIDMYAHLHMFQDIVATIIEKHGIVKTKLTQFNTIQGA